MTILSGPAGSLKREAMTSRAFLFRIWGWQVASSAGGAGHHDFDGAMLVIGVMPGGAEDGELLMNGGFGFEDDEVAGEIEQAALLEEASMTTWSWGILAAAWSSPAMVRQLSRLPNS